MTGAPAYLLHGLASVSDVLGDFIVYRNLRPADRRLPGWLDLCAPLGLDPRALPRKAEPAYGRVLAEILRVARRLDRPGTSIRRLLYVGDTHMNDGSAFLSLCAAGAWPGWAFIGSDDLGRPPVHYVEDSLFVANRWAALPDLLQMLQSQDFCLDGDAAVVIDLDKTFIGARGRNDRVIDDARVLAIRRTVAHLLGPRFDAAAFVQAYDRLKQPAFHPFTADNQDYLAYVCLVLGAGLFPLDGLIDAVQSGATPRFGHFLSAVHARRSDLALAGLETVHDDVWNAVLAGDPTPFKAFRYQEYIETAARLGDLAGASVGDALAQRIVITHEVLHAAAALRDAGALVFGVSDKPDEASLPSPDQAAAGMQPLHRLRTLVVGQA